MHFGVSEFSFPRTGKAMSAMFPFVFEFVFVASFESCRQLDLSRPLKHASGWMHTFRLDSTPEEPAPRNSVV